ncbi:MAG TPA: UDP-N-acetylmuramoyl-tripeptide--D-alanyl-D-alanine ligase [Pelomicrobium sp.]|nr:UDP-N-acetylmuramoyl-tripeptide--D-alanyl-D-alanine ligase [Pelomicrobium sp.]
MMDLADAARAVSGEVRGANVRFAAVSTDSRALHEGALFVALRGERFDGHDSVEAAGGAGAAAALVDADWALAHPDVALPLVVADDARIALGQLAAAWRARFAIPLVALTGSNGKTTVKEMLASILREATGNPETVLATQGNLNNDIGVPLMLLRLRGHHRFAVIEMGMNHAGEIAYLTGLARPTVALVTNAGQAHIEFLGSVEAIARAKGEIFDGLRADGVAVLNADDAHVSLWREQVANHRVIDFGLDHPAAVSAQVTALGDGAELALQLPQGECRARLSVPGAHNVRNALAAAAAASALGIAPEAIGRGLTQFRGIAGRLAVVPGRSGAVVIDDTYNANPQSMRAALAVLAGKAGRRVFVMGDMGELGQDAMAMHRGIGEAARELGVDALFALGEQSKAAAEAFGGAGRSYARVEELLADLEKELAPGVTVLVKGSRFMRMERVVISLAASAAPAAAGG